MPRGSRESLLTSTRRPSRAFSETDLVDGSVIKGAPINIEDILPDKDLIQEFAFFESLHADIIHAVGRSFDGDGLWNHDAAAITGILVVAVGEACRHVLIQLVAEAVDLYDTFPDVIVQMVGKGLHTIFHGQQDLLLTEFAEIGFLLLGAFRQSVATDGIEYITAVGQVGIQFPRQFHILDTYHVLISVAEILHLMGFRILHCQGNL